MRIYIDTSVVGGYFDDEFSADTKALFKRLEKGEVVFVVSDLMLNELENAPASVKELKQYSPDNLEYVFETADSESLAYRYIEDNIIGASNLGDCRHIALATINNVYVLASWNFKHIVNLYRIKGYNSVNLKIGYNIIEIRNPKELLIYETI